MEPDNMYVLLTGASSGIGREMAVKLSAGHRLILNGRNQERLEQTLRSCSEPERHLIWARDLSKVETLGGDLASFLVEHSATVCGFIHSAAILKILPLRSLGLALTREIFDTNFFSAMEITTALMKKKVNHGGLRNIVFISSIASKYGAKGFSAYCASKGALDSLMKALAVELAPEVRVNSVLPGGVRTKMTETIFDDPDMEAAFQRDYPLGIGNPEDVIHAVEFLISNEARWITGQQMVVDGGRTANITA